MNVNVQRIDNGAKLTEAELDACIQASWPPRRASEPQPMAAEAATEVDELPADSEYDFSHSDSSRDAAAWFWSAYLVGSIALVCALLAQFLPS